MRKLSRTKNSLLNISASITTQILLSILKFACRTVFIQTLGKSYLGINGLFSDILTMLSLTELGLDTAINFKLYKPLAENNEKQVRILMKFYKYAYRVVGSIIFLLGICLIPLLPVLIRDYELLPRLGINPVLIFLLFLLQSVTSYLFSASRSAILKANQQEYIVSIVGFLSQLVLNVVQIITLLIWKNFILYTALAIFFGIFSNLFLAFIAKRKYPAVFESTPDKISKEEVKDIFKDLGALFIYKVNGVVLKATDNLVLSSFIGLTIVGIYSNYLLFYTTIKSFLAKFYSAVKASMGNLYAKESIDKRYKFFEIMNFLTFILYGTACVGIAVVADELINVWIGKEYIIAQPFSVLIGIEVLFAGLKQNLGQIRNVTGAFRQMWYRPLMGIAINLIVSIFAVRFIGIYGVILGTIVADFSTNFMIDPAVIYKHSFQNYRPVSEYYIRNVKYMALLLFIGIADYFACKYIVPGHGWLSVIIHIAICAISVPIGFTIVFYNRHECKYLLSLTTGLLNRKKKKCEKH